MSEKQANTETDRHEREAVEDRKMKTGDEEDASCRCKEAQGKTIGDFVRVMLDDLAFWKKR